MFISFSLAFLIVNEMRFYLKSVYDANGNIRVLTVFETFVVIHFFFIIINPNYDFIKMVLLSSIHNVEIIYFIDLNTYYLCADTLTMIL